LIEQGIAPGATTITEPADPPRVRLRVPGLSRRDGVTKSHSHSKLEEIGEIPRLMGQWHLADDGMVVIGLPPFLLLSEPEWRATKTELNGLRERPRAFHAPPPFPDETQGSLLAHHHVVNIDRGP